MPEITSLQNPLVKQVVALRERRREREQQGLAVLEGVRVAEEAVSAGLELVRYFYTEELTSRERGQALYAELARRSGEGCRVTEQVLAKLADTATPQGVVAVFRIPAHRLAELPAGPGPVLVADGLQDPGNLGTLIRTAEALGGAGVAATGGTVDPWSPKVVRAAAGSLFRLPVARGGPVAEVLGGLKARGFRVLVTDPDEGRPVWAVDWTGAPAALVVGSEGAGPSAAARALADETVRIPMPGPAESLNAGVAGAICLYEALRQREAAGR